MKQKTLIDQIGVSHTFDSVPMRIISLVPSQTELLYDLGLEDKIIGITKFCIHPYHFKTTKKKVGGTKKVHFEKIRLLQPDIIICNKEENTLEMVTQLRKICCVWVTDIITIRDNLQMVTDFGQIFNCLKVAQKWNDSLALAISDFKDFIKCKPRLKTVYFIWKDPYMIAGSHTYINELLHLNHFENNYPSTQRYPQITLEDLKITYKPQLLLLSSEPFPFAEKHILEIKQYAPDARILLVDGEMFSWYGSRLIKSLAYFKELHGAL